MVAEVMVGQQTFLFSLYLFPSLFQSLLQEKAIHVMFAAMYNKLTHVQIAHHE